MINHIRGGLLALFRQRIAFWAVLLASLAAAAAGSILPAPVWRARATMMVPQTIAEPDGISLLSSRDLHAQIVGRLGANALYPQLDGEAAVSAFGRDLNANASGDNLEVTYDGRDPVLAARAIDAVIAGYLERRQQLLTQTNSGNFDQQAALYQSALDEARSRLNSYRQSNKVTSGDEERRQLLRQRAEIDSELKRTLNSIAELNAKMRSMKSQMSAIPETVAPALDPATHYKAVDDAKGKLLDLKLKESELLAKYKEGSQFVQTVREEIAQVQTFIDDMSRSMDQRAKPSANELYVEQTKDILRTETTLNSLEGRRAALETQLPEIEHRIDQVNAGASELRQLEQAEVSAEAAVRQIEEARLAQAVGPGQGGGVAVVERPTPPLRPVRPDPILYFALAISGGLLGGLGLALLLNAASSTFSAPAEVERRLGLPVLAVLPLKR